MRSDLDKSEIEAIRATSNQLDTLVLPGARDQFGYAQYALAMALIEGGLSEQEAHVRALELTDEVRARI